MKHTLTINFIHFVHALVALASAGAASCMIALVSTTGVTFHRMYGAYCADLSRLNHVFLLSMAACLAVAVLGHLVENHTK